MNTIFRNLLRGGALAAALSSRLFAGDPLPAPPAAGKLLVFDHGGVIEGEVERVGGRFRIRSGMGETWVPAAGVLGVAADKEAAFQLLKQRANLKDPKDHVRLAALVPGPGTDTGCRRGSRRGLGMRPGDRWLQLFRDEMKTFAAAVPAGGGAVVHTATPSVAASDAAPIEVNPESLGLFVTKVQPILMNACAKCHTGEYGGKFKLAEALAPGNAKAINANLAAASAAIDRQQTGASPLLIKAVAVHGDASAPPLKDRQTAAYKHLEEWVRLATGSPVTSKPPAALPSAVMADAQPLPPARGTGFANDPDVKPTAAKPGDPPAMPAPADAPKGSATPVPGDPFDPAIFNQQTQPKKP